MALTQFHTLVKKIRSDNGSEFIALKPFFHDNGILFETSCVGTPQQNGRAERKHRHIHIIARSLMFQASLPIKILGVMHPYGLLSNKPYSYSSP